MKLRVQRIALQLQREMSDILQHHLKDPRIGFVTVTDVDVTNDLAYAKIYVSVMGTEEQKQESMRGLERARGFIRSELGARMRLRVVPELQFRLDQSIDYSARIEHVLHEILPPDDTLKVERKGDDEDQ